MIYLTLQVNKNVDNKEKFSFLRILLRKVNKLFNK